VTSSSKAGLHSAQVGVVDISNLNSSFISHIQNSGIRKEGSMALEYIFYIQKTKFLEGIKL